MKGKLALAAMLLLGGCQDLRADPGPDGAVETPDGIRRQFESSALILDQGLMHVSTWVDVIQELETLGVSTRYRRFYPHLTAADVRSAAGGKRPYEIIVMAAGLAPDRPSGLMRFAEIELAVEHVGAGGTLILAVESGLSDMRGGENDWFIQNRILERLGAGIRVDRNIVVAQRFDGNPVPPHVDTELGYPTPLEPAIAYPYVTQEIRAIDVTKLAAGSAPLLLTAGENAVTIASVQAGVLAWRELAGPTSERYREVDEVAPVVAIATAGSGHIVVVPRGLLTLSATTGRLSDKPALRDELQGENRRFVRGLLGWVHDLFRGEVTWSPNDQPRDDALFRVAADGQTALSGTDEVRQIPIRINTRSLPPMPPGGSLHEELPVIGRPAELPEWWHTSGGRLAWGEVPADVSATSTLLADIASHELDGLVTLTLPERLHGLGLDATTIQRDRDMYAQVSEMAESASVPWIIGTQFAGEIYRAAPNDFPSMVGAQGQLVAAPAPVYIPFWDRAVIPTCTQVAQLVRDHSGIQGLLFDLELYDGPTFHVDAYAFSDATVVEAVAAWPHDSDLAELLSLAADQRLDWLIDRGELGEYFRTLTEVVRLQATRCRDIVHEVEPDVWFLVYVPAFPSSWFYRGFLQGLATNTRPVIVLTYESWSGRADEVLRGQGINLVHAGGTDVRYYRPSDFASVIQAMSSGNAGYWYRSFNEISTITETSPPHGDSSDYRAAMDDAHRALESD